MALLGKVVDKLKGLQVPMIDNQGEKAVETSVYGKGDPIGLEQIQEAADILSKYKQGKANLDNRVIQDELWWELRHWEAIGKNKKNENEPVRPEPASAWLVNSLITKHADMMDNYPEAIVLPREESDEKSAKLLSQVLPVVLEQNHYDTTYDEEAWEKIKHGTGVYGIFWNSDKDNGLGDIDITNIDLLNIYWEPGIKDIQKSKHIFTIELVDTKVLDEMYPEHEGEFKGNPIDAKEYIYNESIDTSDKVVVVDWYYKKRTDDGRTLLHYCKFCGKIVLYASENDPNYQGRGYYDHGKYPFVFDVMYPEKGTPVGFGYVSICRNPQLYIDKLSGNILETSMMGSKKRYFVSRSTNVNKKDFLDWNNPIIEVEGEISDARIKEVSINPLDGIYVNVLQQKIDEMKETSSNRDVSNGGSTSTTAASAIAALQEAGNKVSRDVIYSSYRAFKKVIDMVIELMRQFYDEDRAFRIVMDNGAYKFVKFSNAGLKDQPTVMIDGEQLFRKPIFDLKVKTQKRNPFSRMEQNETAKELYKLGFFDPARADQALIALDMMDFEGIEKVKGQVAQGQTMYSMLLELQKQVAGILGGQMGGQAEQSQEQPTSTAKGAQTTSQQYANGLRDANKPQMTSYGQKLAERSRPDATKGNRG